MYYGSMTEKWCVATSHHMYRSHLLCMPPSSFLLPSLGRCLCPRVFCNLLHWCLHLRWQLVSRGDPVLVGLPLCVQVNRQNPRDHRRISGGHSLVFRRSVEHSMNGHSLLWTIWREVRNRLVINPGFLSSCLKELLILLCKILLKKPKIFPVTTTLLWRLLGTDP